MITQAFYLILYVDLGLKLESIRIRLRLGYTLRQQRGLKLRLRIEEFMLQAKGLTGAEEQRCVRVCVQHPLHPHLPQVEVSSSHRECSDKAPLIHVTLSHSPGLFL